MDLQLVTTADGDIRLQGILRGKIGGITFVDSANGTSEEIFLLLIQHDNPTIIKKSTNAYCSCCSLLGCSIQLYDGILEDVWKECAATKKDFHCCCSALVVVQ